MLAMLIIFIVVVMTLAGQDSRSHSDGTSNVSAEFFQLPTAIDKRNWRQKIPQNNHITTVKVTLGRTLFFDKRLSIDGSVSCATCHDPRMPSPIISQSRSVFWGAPGHEMCQQS